MFPQFIYCSGHCLAVAQLLAVHSSEDTRKGAAKLLLTQIKDF